MSWRTTLVRLSSLGDVTLCVMMATACESTRESPSALALLAPSALTLSALCCGMTSIREAARGEFTASLFWLGVSAIFDGLDGHVARRLNAVTRFGGELDSLCDLVDFGAVRAWPACCCQLRPVSHASPGARA